MAETYSPIISGRVLDIAIWVVSILALIFFVIFILYVGTSKERTRRGTLTYLIITSLLFAIDLQLIFYENGVVF